MASNQHANPDERRRRGLLALLLLLAGGVVVLIVALASGDGKGSTFKKDYRQTDAALRQFDGRVVRAVRPAQSNAHAVREAEIVSLARDAASIERGLRGLNPPARSAPGVERLRSEVSELAARLDALVRAIRAHNLALIASTSRTLVVLVPTVSQQSQTVAGSSLAAASQSAAPSPRGVQHLHLGQTATLHARLATASGVYTWALAVTVVRVVPLQATGPAGSGAHAVGVCARVRNVGSGPYRSLGEDAQALITSTNKQAAYGSTYTGPPPECSVLQTPMETIKLAPGQAVAGCNPYVLERGETAKAVRWELPNGTDAAVWGL